MSDIWRSVYFWDFWGGSGYGKHQLVMDLATISGKLVRGSGWGRQWHPGKEAQKIAESSLLIVFNGSEPGCEWARRIAARNNVPVASVEGGLWDQRSMWGWDSHSRTSLRSLLHPFDPGLLKLARAELAAHALKLRIAPRKVVKGKAVLALQHPLDSSIYTMSAKSSHQDMYEKAESCLPSSISELVVCPHPVSTEEPWPVMSSDRARYKQNGIATIEECIDAEVVCAISSGILWEAAGLGCDIHLLGDKYSKAWRMLTLHPEAMAAKARANHSAVGDCLQAKEIIERILSVSYGKR